MERQPLSILAQNWLKSWSGKEDSNLRPLPPEGGGPAFTRRIPVIACFTRTAYSRVCSPFIHGIGSKRTFDPCLNASPSRPDTLAQTLASAVANLVSDNEIIAALEERERLREALTRLRVAASILQNNSELCAVNHYGHSFEEHGRPMWLTDTAKDITFAEDVLGSAALTGSSET